MRGNEKKNFFKPFFKAFMSFILLLIIVEFLIGSYFINKISDNVYMQKQSEAVNSFESFLSNVKSEYFAFLLGYAWWNDIAIAARDWDFDLIDEYYAGDRILTGTYDFFNFATSGFQFMIHSIDDEVTVTYHGNDHENRNIEIENYFYGLTKQAFLNEFNSHQDYYTFLENNSSDIHTKYIWHYNVVVGEDIYLISLSPICDNWGYPFSKGYFAIGNKYDTLIMEASRIIPAEFTIHTDRPGSENGIIISTAIGENSEFFIEIDPLFKIDTILKRLLRLFVFIQVIMISMVFAFVYPYYTKKYTLHLQDQIDLKTKELNASNKEFEEKNRELIKAMENVKVLSGFLPICSKCKKIRNDKGYWGQVEAYIQENSEIVFSHSLCPECHVVLYPNIEIDD